MSCQAVDGTDCNVKLLRPKPNTLAEEHERLSAPPTQHIGNRVIDIDILNSSLSAFAQEHTTTSCHSYQPQIVNATKVGVTMRASLTCISCGVYYRQRSIRFYAVAASQRRGPKQAAINKQLAYALQELPIGVRGGCQLIACMDLPPPCESGLQRMANTVAAETEILVDNQLQERRSARIANNALVGVTGAAGRQVAISIDTRYNSQCFGSSKKLGPSATQAISTVMDSKTGEIIQYGLDENNESEREMNKKLAERLVINGLLPTVVTSDNDGKGADSYGALLSIGGWEVTPQSDPVHLANSQMRAVTKADFSCQMFGVRTKKDKAQYQQLLSRDIRHRTSVALNRIKQSRIINTDTDAHRNTVAEAVPTVLKCLTGNHSACRLHQLGCHGTDANNWMRQSSLLYAVAGIDRLHADNHDKHLLQEVLKIRLHSSALEATRLGYDTQRNEAFNRKLSLHLPKNIFFKRNAKGRLAGAVHSHNTKRVNSIILKLQHGRVGITSGSPASKFLTRLQDRIDYIRHYQKSRRAKAMRVQQQIRQAKVWWQRRQARAAYCKGQSNPYHESMMRRDESSSSVSSGNGDHGHYCI